MPQSMSVWIVESKLTYEKLWQPMARSYRIKSEADDRAEVLTCIKRGGVRYKVSEYRRVESGKP